VEGLSEFLPISSTGHLILASALMKLTQTDAHKVFEVTIQSGAMLAVVYIYRKQLVSRMDLLKKLCFAFFPSPRDISFRSFFVYEVTSSTAALAVTLVFHLPFTCRHSRNKKAQPSEADYVYHPTDSSKWVAIFPRDGRTS